MTDTREQFEAHFALSQRNALRDSSGKYWNEFVQLKWEGWQAAMVVAEKDAARLDWLEANPGFQLEKWVTWRNGNDEYDGIERSYWKLTTNDDDEFTSDNLRAAIDAADIPSGA